MIIRNLYLRIILIISVLIYIPIITAAVQCSASGFWDSYYRLVEYRYDRNEY
jgi:hypothetical protein